MLLHWPQLLAPQPATSLIASTPLLMLDGIVQPPDQPPLALRIAVVGDCHDQWDADDNAALAALAPDLVLLVGDFGNENAGLVHELGKLQDHQLVPRVSQRR
jgi:hypothetical protein|tara:strand:- start:5239 stop:5544 length:306 start_codon:yes stop_codon:yes gene_type:complete